MDVGHGQAGAYDPRQRGHVHGLLQREVFSDLIDDALASVDHDVGAHPAPLVPTDEVTQGVDSL